MKEISLQLVKKDSKTYKFQVSRDGVAVDISGWFVYFTVKKDFNDLDVSALILKSYQFPTNAESASGVGYLALTSSETNITIDTYFYDFKFIDGTYRETFMRGKLDVVPTIRLA